MQSAEIQGLLAFLRHAERLKTVTRTAWTSEGKRESTAEHTWRLCLFALSLRPWFPQLDFERVLSIATVHDLGEAISGDISAVDQVDGPAKLAQERHDLLHLLSPAPSATTSALVSLWEEYNSASTPEAKFVKAIDKLETILQHNQGSNPVDFDYAFNLPYGQQYTSHDPVLVQLRAILDADTASRADEKPPTSTS
ncbi:MAG: HD domain-containing protein [Candidatus Didemnitutus sp.]|nr:HD domain-containing protein [Candidatus Didemnitutus sp.]